jgi:hypothetical protein
LPAATFVPVPGLGAKYLSNRERQMSRNILIGLVAVLVIVVMALTMMPESGDNTAPPPAVGDQQQNPAAPAD